MIVIVCHVTNKLLSYLYGPLPWGLINEFDYRVTKNNQANKVVHGYWNLVYNIMSDITLSGIVYYVFTKSLIIVSHYSE